MDNMERLLRKEGIRNESDLRDAYTWEDARNDTDKSMIDETIESEESVQIKDERERIERIKQYIENYDKIGKALTGRTPERIEEEDGIKRERAFPDGAKILYVGDPWQRMGKEIDNENMTIIDYEYGDVASFIMDDEEFRRMSDGKAGLVLNRLNYLQQIYDLSQKEKEWTLKLKTMLEEVDAIQKNTMRSESAGYEKKYEELAEEWKKIKEYISLEHKDDLEKGINEEESEKGKGEVGDPQKYTEYDEFSRFRRDAWYAAVFCERGFRDVPDWNNIILPELEKLASDEERKVGRKLTDEERAEFFQKKAKSLIEKIRLKKETNRANVVEGSFLELPFKDGTFDRFVASWSISAHIFDVSDKEDFDLYWQEIHRVLKKDGEAYIFPLDFYYDNKENMLDSLAGQSRLEYRFLETSGEETDDPYDAHTLVLKKVNR